MLCYIEADRYGNDLATLEEVVETFTYFPLNEICGGFFFGAFNILLAIEDMPGMQSLYLKTHVRGRGRGRCGTQMDVLFGGNAIAFLS